MGTAIDTEGTAAAWLVRLDADTSAVTLAQWQQWLREDARHHAAFERVEKGWRQAECLRSLRPLDGAVTADLLDDVPGVVSRAQRRFTGWGRSYSWQSYLWRPLNAARAPAPFITLAVVLGGGAVGSLLVLAGWLLCDP